MFRCSIRELLLAVAILGMGITWWMDHARLSATLASSKKGEYKLRMRTKFLDEEMRQINDELAKRGLGIWQIGCGGCLISISEMPASAASGNLNLAE